VSPLHKANSTAVPYGPQSSVSTCNK